MKNSFNIKEVSDFWDEIADIYEPANSSVGYVHYQRFERGMRYLELKEGQTVLNVWSRMGGLIPYIKNVKNIKLYNREVAPKFLKIAKERFPRFNFELTDLEDFSEFEDNYFDRIISLETLEHVPNPSVFLKEIYRILKPGAKVIFSLPPKGFEIPTIIWDKFFGNHGEGPHRFLWPNEVRKLLKEASINLDKHVPTIILPLKSDKLERLSERVLTFIFGKTPVANFGVRHFYICSKRK